MVKTRLIAEYKSGIWTLLDKWGPAAQRLVNALVSRTVMVSPSWTPTTRPVKVGVTLGDGKKASATKTHKNLDMLDLKGYGRLAKFIKLTDRMIGEASKDAIVNAARMLAVQVGHYQRKFAALPMEDAIALLKTETLSEDQAGWVADGLENLAVAIAFVKDD